MKLPKSGSQGEQNIHSVMITMRTNGGGEDDDRDIASTRLSGEMPTTSFFFLFIRVHRGCLPHVALYNCVSNLSRPLWPVTPRCAGTYFLPHLRCKSPVKSDKCPKVSRVESGRHRLGCEIETCNQQIHHWKKEDFVKVYIEFVKSIMVKFCGIF